MMLTTILNQALSLDPKATVYLKELDQKCLSVRIQKISDWLAFYVIFSQAGVQITTQEHTADATVSGPARAFLTLVLTKDPHRATQLGLTLEGDSAILENIQQLLWSLDIDWEELLSQYTGDVPANQLGALFKVARKKKMAFTQNMMQNFSEYLKEEIHFFPPKPSVDDFINNVDQLRTNVERLEARVEHLLQKEML